MAKAGGAAAVAGVRMIRRVLVPSWGRGIDAALDSALEGALGASRVYAGGISPQHPWHSPASSPAPLTSSAAHPAAAGVAGAGVPHLGPSVKILLDSSGLNAASIPGTGPHGILTKGDVLNAIARGRSNPTLPTTSPPPPPQAAAAPPPPPPPPAAASAFPLPATGAVASGLGLPPAQNIPTTQLRRIIGARLLESKLGSPHFYAQAEALIDETLSLRQRLKAMGVGVSVNDFVIKAAATALQQVPEATAMWDSSKQALVMPSSIDIAIAVATPKGLFTPILKNVPSKSLSGISEEVKSLAAKARAGTLLPEEFQGGCFTISNLGMFPIDRFSAIINPPQPCILAVGRGDRVVRWLQAPSLPGEEESVPGVVTKMEVTLSADARAMGADVAGKFLSRLCAILKDPIRLVV